MHHTCRDDLNIITDATTARACVCVLEREIVLNLPAEDRTAVANWQFYLYIFCF